MARKGDYWRVRKFYNAREWPKANYWTFLSRVARWISLEEAIDPKSTKVKSELSIFYDKYRWKKVSISRFAYLVAKWIPKEKALKGWSVEECYPKEYEIWKKLPRPKCNFSWFIERLNKGWSIERAAAPKKRNPNYYIAETYEEKKKVYKKSDYLIEVTLPPEEAIAFHREYRSMLNELEEKYYKEENCIVSMKIHEELENLKEQYKVFLSYNPISPWTVI